ncbi:MAG: class-II fumarase/aspartase family protein [Egibacteraceae bacterium]
MTAHVMDSAVYGHLWGTPELREEFCDAGRTQSWLDILAALASAQAEIGMIPEAAATEIADKARVELVDLEEVATRTRRTGHSTLGLIQVLRALLGPGSGEWVYYGATVQDVTDTWTGLVMQRVTAVMVRDLRRIEAELLGLASTHRDTIMVGRTHGQPGSPITFGFKAAVWAAEVRRHVDRWLGCAQRLAVGQLAGAVGTCSFWGERGLELQERFCQRLGLGVPDMTWLTARDRVAEFVWLLGVSTGTVAKIGREVYNLARLEVSELAEGFRHGQVGSITMPHKRNPELSEHLGTLARVVRSAAGLALEGMVCDHERDGAAWKAEWAFLPEACMAAGAAVALGADLVAGLQVDAARMARNLERQSGYVLSEPVLAFLAPRLGKHTAAEVVYEAAMAGIDRAVTFRDALMADPRVVAALSEAELDGLLDPANALGQCGALVDRVVAHGSEG